MSNGIEKRHGEAGLAKLGVALFFWLMKMKQNAKWAWDNYEL